MGVALLLTLAGVLAATLLPVSIRIVVGWDDEKRTPWSISVLLWRFDLLRGRRRSARPRHRAPEGSPDPTEQPERNAPIPPWLWRLLRTTSRSLWERFQRNRRERKAGRTRPDPLLPFLARLGRAVLLRPTRRLRLELGGIDPATLGALYGVFLSVEPLVPGNSTISFEPRWGLVHARCRVLWHLRFSLAGLLGGILFPGRRTPRPLLPSVG